MLWARAFYIYVIFYDIYNQNIFFLSLHTSSFHTTVLFISLLGANDLAGPGNTF